MSVDVTTEIVIACPVWKVAAYTADPSNAPAWYVNIRSVHWRTPPPVAVGSRVAFVADFMGRPMAYTYEVVDFAAGQHFVMRTIEGPFPMETTYLWQPAGSGTKMTLRNHGVPKGLSPAVARVMALAMRNTNRRDLARLKHLLESRPRG